MSTIKFFGITLHWGSKDGGPQSTVWCSGLEIKWLFSVLLLRFENGSRDAYHSHAFNSVSLVLSGALAECFQNTRARFYDPSLAPVFTSRETHHKVISFGTTYVLSLRGPWAKTWKETSADGQETTLAHGRAVVAA